MQLDGVPVGIIDERLEVRSDHDRVRDIHALAAQFLDDGVKVVSTIPTGEQYGFAMAKENTEVQTLLNEGLTAVRDDGTYDELFEKYFPNAG